MEFHVKNGNNVSDLQLTLARKIINLVSEEAYPVDTHIREVDLTERFSVSRTPVRAALNYLADCGIVEKRTNRGYFLIVETGKYSELPMHLPQKNDDKICETIARDWFEGHITEQVSETEIRRRYELGRLTASKILQKMAEEGIMSRLPGYGWRFEPTLNTAAAHDESYDFRILTEPSAILMPTFRPAKGAIKNLRARHEAVLNSKRTKWNISFLFSIDVDFHNFIAECSGNRFIISAIARQNRLRRLVEYVSLIDKGRWHASCREHLDILDAIQGGKIKTAARLMARHLTKAKEMGPSFEK